MEPNRTEPHDLRLKVKWLIALRVGIVSLLLGASIVLQIGYGKSGQATLSFSYLIAGTYFLTILYSLLLYRIQRVFLFASVQIGVDLLFITGLVYLTGGIASPFSPFYMVATISASMLLGRKGGRMAAFFSSVLLGALVYVQLFHELPGFENGLYTYTEAVYFLFLNVMAILGVAYLSGSLAEKLTRTQVRLRQESTGFAELKAFHECIVQSMSSGLLSTSLEGEITSFNRAAEEITGFWWRDVKGKFWWDVLGAEDLKHLFNPNKPLSEAVRFDRTFKRAAGGTLLLGLTVSPLRNELNIQIGSVWTFQNLTRIREMEEEIENKKRLATIGEMAAGMAHEIRNPLAALSGSIQVLHKGKGLDQKEARQLMSIALKETDRLDAIITSFLLYARPAPLRKKTTNINRLIEETMNLLKNSKDFSENIEIGLELQGGDLKVAIDPDRIRQVFWNLSINAVEAMPRGGRFSVASRSVDPSNSDEDGKKRWIEILFSDSGMGMNKSQLGKIFYPFFTTKDHGSGLGLPIVYRIIEEHGGRIHVDSKPEQGTRFTILLPFEVMEEAVGTPDNQGVGSRG